MDTGEATERSINGPRLKSDGRTELAEETSGRDIRWVLLVYTVCLYMHMDAHTCMHTHVHT